MADQCWIAPTWIVERLDRFATERTYCSEGPVCEFGKYGPAANVWGVFHDRPSPRAPCTRCGELWISEYIPDIDTFCQHGEGGRCGGETESPDRINVVPCDGTVTVDALLYGPIWIASEEIRRAGGDPEKIGLEGVELTTHLRLQRAARLSGTAAICELLGRHEFEGDTCICIRCGIIREMLTPPVRTKIEVDDRVPRDARGPVSESDFRAARKSALQNWGVTLRRRRRRRRN